MELGATICLPKNPQCLLCPVSPVCRRASNGRQSELPVKIVSRKSVRETRVLFWIERSGSCWFGSARPHSRLMPGFWELPERTQLPGSSRVGSWGSFRHGITSHNYTL